jgi:uncharacterized protein
MSSRKVPRHLLLVAGLALGVSALEPARAAADESPGSVIVAHGSGEVHVRPDSVRIDVGVEAQAATLDQARTQVSTAMAHVLDAIHALNLPGVTVETRQVRFNPVYGEAREGHPPAIVGFSADNHILVTARHAPDAELAARSARLVDTALNAGANAVGSIEFFLADSSHAEDEALTLAVANAESDAQVMAQAAHVTIGGPVWIEESSASRVPRSLAMEAALVSTPIEVGDVTIQSSVTAKFTFH